MMCFVRSVTAGRRFVENFAYPISQSSWTIPDSVIGSEVEALAKPTAAATHQAGQRPLGGSRSKEDIQSKADRMNDLVRGLVGFVLVLVVRAQLDLLRYRQVDARTQGGVVPLIELAAVIFFPSRVRCELIRANLNGPLNRQSVSVPPTESALNKTQLHLVSVRQDQFPDQGKAGRRRQNNAVLGAIALSTWKVTIPGAENQNPCARLVLW